MDPLVIVALLLAAVLIAAFLALRGGSIKRGSTVLLIGPSGAGKTLTFVQLRDGRDIPTHTSMSANDDTFVLKAARQGNQPAPETPVHVVDCPGAPQLQPQMLSRVAGAGVIVCMLDASDPLEQSKHVAGVLYELFLSDAMRRLRIPILIACNHSDSAKAMRSVQLRGLIEKGIDRIQLSRTTMQDLSDKAQGSRISPEGVPFTFREVRARARREPAPLPAVQASGQTSETQRRAWPRPHRRAARAACLVACWLGAGPIRGCPAGRYVCQKAGARASRRVHRKASQIVRTLAFDLGSRDPVEIGGPIWLHAVACSCALLYACIGAYLLTASARQRGQTLVFAMRTWRNPTVDASGPLLLASVAPLLGFGTLGQRDPHELVHDARHVFAPTTLSGVRVR
jgi:signal recognition particle receptor subunit beta